MDRDGSPIDTHLRGDFEKNGVFVEVEFGNVASLYRDLFKFHIAGTSGAAEVGIIVVATAQLAAFFDQGQATWETATGAPALHAGWPPAADRDRGPGRQRLVAESRARYDEMLADARGERRDRATPSSPCCASRPRWASTSSRRLTKRPPRRLAGDGSPIPLVASELRHQLAADALDEADDEGVAHHEGAPAIGHAGVRPVVREAVEALELARGQATVAPVLDLDEVLEARRGAAALAGQDRPRGPVRPVGVGDGALDVEVGRVRALVVALLALGALEVLPARQLVGAG